MKPMKRMILTLLLMITLPTVGLAQQSKHVEPAKAKKGLKAEHLETIQAIGRSVLAAKHSQETDPELEQLRQRVKALRGAVKALHRLDVNAGKGTVTIVDPGTQKSKSPRAAPNSLMHQKRQAALENLKTEGAKLRTHRLAMKPLNKKMERPSARRRAALAERAKIKTQELEKEIEAYFASSPEEQPTKLNQLLEHLAPQHPRRAIRQEETPTLSTITRHRHEGR